MKKKILLLASMAMLLTGCQEKVITVAGLQSEDGQETTYIEMKEFQIKEPQTDSGREEVSCCAVLIPTGYYESEEIPGMYIHERSPLDSSNIYYTVSEGSGEGRVSDALTEESYQELVEEAYQEIAAFPALCQRLSEEMEAQEISVEIESFERIDMEGVPGYKVRSSSEIDSEKMQQLTYMILGEDTYTITYSQMSDDELMADFEISDGEIRLVREEEVSLAQNEG